MTTFNIANLTGEDRQALEALRNMPVQLGEILEKARLEVIHIGLDTSLSLAGKNERYDQSARRFMAQVDQMEQAAQAYKADLERWIASKLRQPQGDPNVELLYEIRTDKAWRRIERILDGTGDRAALIRTVFDLTDDAIKRDDQVTLAAIDQELPAYFQARSMVMPPDLAERIRQAKAVHASPQERQALALQEELEAGFPRLMVCFGQVKRALQERATVGILPGWSADEQITLDLPKEPAGFTWQ